MIYIWKFVFLQFQPSKQKNKQKADFETDFQFVSSIEEYNKDSWNDLSKYIKRTVKTKTDDKIRVHLQKDKTQQLSSDNDIEESNEKETEIFLSDDELKPDKIKVKEKKRKRKSSNDEEFFEEGNLETEIGSFYQMNLSRPLLKAIGEMKFVHPTPIQASTIPVALLGKESLKLVGLLQSLGLLQYWFDLARFL